MDGFVHHPYPESGAGADRPAALRV
jgi:hypothetical protein